MKTNISKLLLCVLLFAAAGCDFSRPFRFHSRVGWHASEYFSDPQQIALCEAIEANDLPEIDRLVAAGADVNAKGKHGMTPLLWAFPEDKLPRFKKLLEYGADPNVVFTGNFQTDFIHPGDTVVHLAAGTQFDGYLKAVLDHGGDPGAVGWADQTPLGLVITSAPSKKERIQLLLDAGADIDQLGASGHTPLIETLAHGGQYRLALFLLVAGADPYARKQPHLLNFLDILVADEIRRSPHWTPQNKSDFDEVERWLKAHGYSVDEARADNQRWSLEFKKRPVVSNFKDRASYKERSARYAEEMKQKNLDQEGKD